VVHPHPAKGVILVAGTRGLVVHMEVPAVSPIILQGMEVDPLQAVIQALSTPALEEGHLELLEVALQVLGVTLEASIRQEARAAAIRLGGREAILRAVVRRTAIHQVVLGIRLELEDLLVDLDLCPALEEDP
jgi:hypothetical protein